MRGKGPIWLLGLVGAASLTAAGAADSATLQNQAAALPPIGAAPASNLNIYPIVDAASARSAPALVAASTPTPVVSTLRSSATPEWLSQSRAAGLRPGDAWTLSTTSQHVTGGAVLGNPDANTLQPVAYDLSYTRAWPSAFSGSIGKYGFDVSPHATFGAGGSGRSAGAGVEARFGKHLANQLVEKLGVKDSSTFGSQGRWYLFAASSGTAVGFNVLHRDGDWSRAGFSQDATSALVGDTQAGLGWRKGVMQASMGYVHRDFKIRQGATDGLMGAADRHDNLVALTFSIKPQR